MRENTSSFGGNLFSSMKRATSSKTAKLADVARLARVSTATVSRTLSLPHKVKPATAARINQAVGREGDVYVTVPGQGQGRGQVRITVDGRQRIYNAVSDGAEFSTSSRVRIARVNEDNTLTVTGV